MKNIYILLVTILFLSSCKAPRLLLSTNQQLLEIDSLYNITGRSDKEKHGVMLINNGKYVGLNNIIIKDNRIIGQTGKVSDPNKLVFASYRKYMMVLNNMVIENDTNQAAYVQFSLNEIEFIKHKPDPLDKNKTNKVVYHKDLKAYKQKIAKRVAWIGAAAGAVAVTIWSIINTLKDMSFDFA